MTRHLRNLAFLAVGWLLAFVAAPAFAAWPTLTARLDVPIGISSSGHLVPQINGQYSIDGISIASTSPDAITIKRTATIGINSSLAQGGKLISKVGQYASIARPAIVSGLSTLVRGGPYSIAGTLLATYLLELGIQHINDSLIKPNTISTVNVSEPGPAHFSRSGQVIKNKYGNRYMAAQSAPSGAVWVSGYYNASTYPLSGVAPGNYWSIFFLPEAIPTPDQGSTNISPETAVTDFVASRPEQAIDDAKGKQIPLPLAPVSNPPFEASPQSQSSPATQPTTTISTASDGTITRTDCYATDQLSFTLDGLIQNNRSNRCTVSVTSPNGVTQPGTTTETSTPVHPGTDIPVDQAKPTTPEATKTDCEKTPGAVGCLPLGDIPTPDELQTQQVPLSFSYSPLSLPQQCPQPQNLNLSVGNVAVEWDAFCTFASGIRPFVIGLAFLSAVFIVFGFRGSENG